MRTDKLFQVACAIIVVIGLAVAEAGATTWNLNDSNVDLGITGNFASVGINVTGHTATFTVDANQALLGTGSNFGIDKFFFNTALSSITAADFAVQSGWRVITGANASTFGSFDFEYKGTGGSRIDPLTFTVSDSSITSALDFYQANSNGSNFVAHIAGFNALNGQTSAFFSDGPVPPAPVPEPSTFILFGAGLTGILFLKRKSAMKASFQKA
jgi:hypothetical protein